MWFKNYFQAWKFIFSKTTKETKIFYRSNFIVNFLRNNFLYIYKNNAKGLLNDVTEKFYNKIFHLKIPSAFQKHFVYN